jgi:hypothetical protein
VYEIHIPLFFSIISVTAASAQNCDTLVRESSSFYNCPELLLHYHKNRYNDTNPAFAAEHKKHSRKDMKVKSSDIEIPFEETRLTTYGLITLHLDVEKNIETGNIYMEGMELGGGCRISMPKPARRVYTLTFTDNKTYTYTEPYFAQNFYDYFLLLRGKTRTLEIDKDGNAGKVSFAQGDTVLLQKLLTTPLKSIYRKETIDNAFRDKYDDEYDNWPNPIHPVPPAEAQKLMLALRCLVESK